MFCLATPYTAKVWNGRWYISFCVDCNILASLLCIQDGNIGKVLS